MKSHVIHSNSFVEDAVNIVVEAAEEAIEARGCFHIALSGGKTPEPVYAELGRIASFPWSRTLITFGDERCVPPYSEESNYHMARHALLSKVPVDEDYVWRIRGELDPEEAAREYEAKLDQAAAKAGDPIFRHDLLLLGMGDDGHTASLFPGTAALEETRRKVVANFVPKFNTHRITMTYPLLNAARHVCFLVSGDSKRRLVEEILAGKSDYPAARVKPESGRLTWLIGL